MFLFSIDLTEPKLFGKRQISDVPTFRSMYWH
jgi:hypothetical protein